MIDAAFSPETNAFWRYRRLSDLIQAHVGPFTPEDMPAINDSVNYCDVFGGKLEPVFGRTLWHSLYDQVAGMVACSFYVGDVVGPRSRYSERRTDYLKLSLSTHSQRPQGDSLSPEQPAFVAEAS